LVVHKPKLSSYHPLTIWNIKLLKAFAITASLAVPAATSEEDSLEVNFVPPDDESIEAVNNNQQRPPDATTLFLYNQFFK